MRRKDKKKGGDLNFLLEALEMRQGTGKAPGIGNSARDREMRQNTEKASKIGNSAKKSRNTPRIEKSGN